jgi:hypothetical protein
MGASTLSFGRLLSGRPSQKQNETYALRRFMVLNGCVVTLDRYAEEMRSRAIERAFA